MSTIRGFLFEKSVATHTSIVRKCVTFTKKGEPMKCYVRCARPFLESFFFQYKTFFRLQDSLFTLCSTCAVDGIMTIETAVNVFAVLFSFDASWKRSFCGPFAQCSYAPDLRAYFAILLTNQRDCSQRVWSRNGLSDMPSDSHCTHGLFGNGCNIFLSVFFFRFSGISAKTRPKLQGIEELKHLRASFQLCFFFVNLFARTERLCGKTAGV